MNEGLKFSELKLCGRFIHKASKYLLITAIVAIVLSGLGAIGNIKTTYVSQAKLYGLEFGNVDNSLRASNILGGYAELLTSEKICSKVVDALGTEKYSVQDIQKMVSVVQQYQTSPVLIIQVQGTNQKDTVKIVNAVAEQFKSEVNQMMGSEIIHNLESASDAQVATKGIVKLILIIGISTIVAEMLLILAICIRVLFSKKVNSIDRCELGDRAMLLGAVPYVRLQKRE